MSVSSITPRTSVNNPFDATMLVDARPTDRVFVLRPQFSESLSKTLVRVGIPGSPPMMLRPDSARELASALLAIATHIDEEAAA